MAECGTLVANEWISRLMYRENALRSIKIKVGKYEKMKNLCKDVRKVHRISGLANVFELGGGFVRPEKEMP